jgi:CheY-like chemotaxis protein
MVQELLVYFPVKKILVLDKSPFIRYLLTRTLQSDMTSVVTVPNIDRAVAAVKEQLQDLFFLDIQTLHNASMGETLRSFKELSPGTKIIMMSEAYPGDEEFRELDEVMDVFISKPFFPSDIRRLAGQAMGLGEYYWDRFETLGEAKNSPKRRWERVPADETIDFTVNTLQGGNKPISLTGNVINRSPSGLGMLTGFPIVAGNLVIFSNGSDPHEGVVTWSRKIDDTTYSAGIFFV